MTQPSPPQRTWFLKDEPLSNLQGQDKFSHNAYVNLLTTTIDELTPPFTLGVLGSWGVGKSSIVNALSTKLAQHSTDTRAVTIDVWKYSDNSLRRQFLYDLQQGLHSQKVLPKGRDYVQEVYQEKTEERPGKQRFDITRLRALAAPLIFVFVLTVVGIALALTWSIPIPAQAVLAALVPPFVLYLVSEFSRSVVVVSKDTVTRPVYFSEDQFERQFEKIVKDAKCKKLIIIVDNLDRCSHELVVETLSTIKTFLEPKGEQKCIFVIPCDDAAIRQHVKAAYRVVSDDRTGDGSLDSEAYAVEYLRKFFSGSIKIDPFLPEEIESYIEHLLSQMKLADDMAESEVKDLVQMVGFLFRDNPRQLKQFLNNVTSKYLLVKEREAGPSPQIKPPISGNRLFLAKVVAIETRFPEIYKRLRDDDNLFFEIHSAALTSSRAIAVKDLLDDNDVVELLESFLQSTGHLTADNPKAFFHLKQSDQEARIPNYTQFESALRRGNVEEVREAYQKGNEETNAARTGVLIRNLVDWTQKGYETYALNAIRVAVGLHAPPTTHGPHISREAIRVLATVPALLGKIYEIRDTNAIFEMAGYAISDHRRRVQDAYVEHFTSAPGTAQEYDAELEDSIAEAFVTHIASLNTEQKSQLRTAISAWGNVRIEQLDILSSTQKAREAFIEPTVLGVAVGSIKAEDLAASVIAWQEEDKFDKVFSILMRWHTLNSQSVADAGAQKLAELLEYATNHGSEELFWYACKVALRLTTLFSRSDPSHLDKIVFYLCQKYQSAESDQKATLAELMCRYHQSASDNIRGSIDSILSTDVPSSLPAKDIARILALHRATSLGAVPWEYMIERLAERLTSGADATEASQFLSLVAAALVPDDYELLMGLAERILERPETQRAVPLVKQVIAELPRSNKGKSLAATLFAGTLGLSDHKSEPGNKELLMQLALEHPELHTKEFRRRLDEHIYDLLVGGDSLRPVGFHALESGYANGALPEERYDAVLHEFTEWLVEQPVTVPLQGIILEWLDRIVDLEGRLAEARSCKRAMIQWLSDRQEESLPADERQATLRQLVTFGRLPEEVLRELIPKVVHQAQNAPDEPGRDSMVESMVQLYSNNNPLDHDLWIDLHVYRRGLQNGDDTQRTAGGRLDRRMRKIREDAGQSQ